MTHDEEMIAVFTDRRRLDWLEENMRHMTHDRASCSVDMSGNCLGLSYLDDGRSRRIRAKSIREAIDKAMEGGAG